MNLSSSLERFRTMLVCLGSVLVLAGFVLVLIGTFNGHLDAFDRSTIWTNLMILSTGALLMGFGLGYLSIAEDSSWMFITSAIWLVLSACVLFWAIYEHAKKLGYNLPF